MTASCHSHAVDTSSSPSQNRRVTRDLGGTRTAPKLVGRERELTTLGHYLAKPPDRKVGVVLIAGEAGIGKTRLVEEAAKIARASGWTVLTGHAYDTDGLPPYMPFIEPLQDHIHLTSGDLLTGLGPFAADLALLLPELRPGLHDLAGSSAGASHDQYRLFESTAEFLSTIARSAPAGLLLCLEDLHWADDSTLRLLEHLSRRPSDASILIFATYRDEEARADSRRMEPRSPEGLDVAALSSCLPAYAEQVRAWRHEAEGDKLALLLKATDAQVTASNIESRISGSILLIAPSQTRDLVTIEQTSGSLFNARQIACVPFSLELSLA